MICLCLDDIKSVGIKVSRLEAAEKRYEKVIYDVSRMGRSKRRGHVKNILSSGRQGEGLGKVGKQNGGDFHRGC